MNWIKAGRLQAHKTAGGHRRIARADLIAFGRTTDIPLPAEVLDPDPTRRKRVLIVDDDRDFAEVLHDFLGARPELDVKLAHTAFAAGVHMGRFAPDLVLVDFSMPDLDPEEMRAELLNDDDLRSIPVLACVTVLQDAAQRARIVAAFDGLLEKPVPLDTLLGEIQRRLGLASAA